MDEFYGLALHELFAFATVAREGSLRRASEALHITEPPLSRKIARLEAKLGARLFERGAAGLELTQAGREALEAVAPLLEMAFATEKKLRELEKKQRETLRIGLSGAFEQGVYERFLAKIRANGLALRTCAMPSPGLVREVLKGRLDAAFVALPLDIRGLNLASLGYSEKLCLALPEKPQMAPSAFKLADRKDIRLFWFKRSQNPAFFDNMAIKFKGANFNPQFLQEPPEHEILLARIAAGEGVAIMPESFAVIKRPGVCFCPLEENWRMEMGLIWRETETGELLKRLLQ